MKLFNLLTIWILSLIFTQGSFSQSIKNVNAQFDGQNMVVTYDLSGGSASDKFKIQLYSSHDNYQKPISFATGAVGDNISLGSQISVTWALTNELPSTFNDFITIKVKATAIVANFTMKPLVSNAFKRGGTLQLLWEGGQPKDQVKIDLMKNNVFQQTLTQTKNTKRHTWNIPKDFDKGTGYTLQLSNTANTNRNAVSSTFDIKPKIPLLLKIAPVIVVGVLVGILSGGGGDNPPTNNGLDELPGSLSPGGG